MIGRRGATWLLYTAWKHRGIMPWKAWADLDQPRWPSRGEAVLKAFAIHAAELEHMVGDVLDSLASGGQ